MVDRKHIDRIKSELKQAGMTPYGFMKLETDHVPEIIHTNEHIKGIVYGRLEKTIDAVMLLATDKRVIFIDCKPFYKNWDEITYEVVAGVKMSIVGPFAGVVLHTRVKEYSLRFVNIKCANIFVEYIENYIEKLDSGNKKSKRPKLTSTPYQSYLIEHDTEKSIKEHLEIKYIDDTAVLSTTDKYGNPHASVVHFEVDEVENFYILTRIKTNKVANINHNNNVVLTIHPSHSLKILHIEGLAEIVNDKEIFQSVYKELSAVREYIEGSKLPPITKIKAGEYVVIKITTTNKHIQDFSTGNW